VNKTEDEAPLIIPRKDKQEIQPALVVNKKQKVVMEDALTKGSYKKEIFCYLLQQEQEKTFTKKVTSLNDYHYNLSKGITSQ